MGLPYGRKGIILDLASALIKQIIIRQDIGTWSLLRRNYLPKEFHSTYASIESFFDRYSKVPTFEEILLDIRTKEVKDKLYALSLQECEDTDPEMLLDFLKNEKAQDIAFDQFGKLIKNSTGFETAHDTVESLLDIALKIEKEIDLEDPDQNMQTIDLFDSEEELENRFKLGLNKDFDNTIDFIPSAYILIGGRRGSGKSLVGCNAVASAYMEGKSSIFFSVEMEVREILQRICAICTGINARRIANRSLSVGEWLKVAEWWAGRRVGGEEELEKYKEHRDFGLLHSALIRMPLHEHKQIEIVYDPEMTIGKVRSELERKVPSLDPSVIVVDYTNQIKVSKISNDQFDWKDQIIISKTLKALAQRYRKPVLSFFQTDASGEARFAKGILDSADAVFVLTAHDIEHGCMEFECTKMRSAPETNFCTEINWENLVIGPNTVTPPKPEAEESDSSSGETDDDLPWN